MKWRREKQHWRERRKGAYSWGRMYTHCTFTTHLDILDGNMYVTIKSVYCVYNPKMTKTSITTLLCSTLNGVCAIPGWLLRKGERKVEETNNNRNKWSVCLLFSFLSMCCVIIPEPLLPKCGTGSCTWAHKFRHSEEGIQECRNASGLLRASTSVVLSQNF